jgi:hypothetical protein
MKSIFASGLQVHVGLLHLLGQLLLLLGLELEELLALCGDHFAVEIADELLFGVL